MSGSRFSIQKPFIYLITEGKTTPENFSENKRKILALARIAAGTEISAIQIREKQLPARLIFELVLEVVKITRRTETKILVNDRADIALAANADGVHLTSQSLSADIIRRSFPADFVVGASTHTFEEAETARRQGADFVAFSPIFSTPAKEKYGAPKGLEKLREVCENLKPFPVVALGGIGENNYESTLESGASGFAAIRFLNNAENLEKLADDLRRKERLKS